MTDGLRKIILEVILVKNHNWIQDEEYDHDIECPICLGSMKDTPVLITSCDHAFHNECIIEAFYNHGYRYCLVPNCRKMFR